MTIEQIVSTLLDVVNNTDAPMNTEAFVEINGVEYSVSSVAYDRTGKEPKIRMELK